MVIIMMPLSESWQRDAACRDLDVEVFFPASGVEVAAAQEICKYCIVRKTCLEYALDNDLNHGVWGGESERGRRRIKKERRQAVAVRIGELVEID